MAIAIHDIDFTDSIRNMGLDSTTAFDEFSSDAINYAHGENLSAASKLDEDDEDDDEDEDKEEDEDSDDEEDEDLDDEDEDEEEEDEDDDEEDDDDDDEEDVDELQVSRRR
jgi:hypothetical protein